jgi:hypothetical protein
MVFLILRDEYPQKNVKMKIRLDEAELQFLGIKRSLSWLYLFKSGESWYNSKGYYEKNYEENKLLIHEFIHQKVVVAYNEEKERGTISSILDPISDEETIQTLFIKVCDILKTDKGNKKCCQCIRLLDITITKFMEFLTTNPDNNFMCTKFYQLYYDPGKDIENYLRRMMELFPPLLEGVGVVGVVEVVGEGEEEVVEEKEGVVKGGRKTRKRRVNKGKNNRSIKRKSNKKSMKRRKGKKTMKRRTKKHKNYKK